MIICSCNIISDCNIKNFIRNAKNPTVGRVFKELGCKPDCATCVQTIARMISEHKEQIKTSD